MKGANGRLTRRQVSLLAGAGSHPRQPNAPDVLLVAPLISRSGALVRCVLTQLPTEAQGPGELGLR